MELTEYRDRFPILARHDVPDQPLARRDARRRGGPRARVHAHVDGARDPGLGRRLVGDADDGRRPDRPHHRRAAGLDRHAPERRRRRGDRALLLPPGRPAPQSRRLRGRQLPERALPLPGAAGARRRRRPGRRGDRRRDRRAHAARADHARPVQDRRRSRTWRRSSAARTRSARTSCSTRTSRPASCRSTSRRSTSTSRSAAASSGSAAGRETAGSTSGPISRTCSSRRSSAGRRMRGRSASSRSSSTPTVRRAFSPARRTCPRSTRRLAGYDLIEEIGVERIRENSVRQTQLLIDLLDEAGFEVGSPRDAARRGGTVTVRTPEFEAVHKELGERQIICDFRPDAGIRLGPHYFNTRRRASVRGRPDRRDRRNRRLRAPSRRNRAVLTARIPLLRESGISRCGYVELDEGRRLLHRSDAPRPVRR